MKKIFISGLIVLSVVFGYVAVQAQSPLIATNVHRICSCGINPADFASITIRNVAVNGTGIVALPLPNGLATVPGGVILQDGKCFIITDVYAQSNLALIDFGVYTQATNTLEQKLFDYHLSTGWHSSVGIAVCGDSANGVGLGIKKAPGPNQPDSLVTIELVGYVQ